MYTKCNSYPRTRKTYNCKNPIDPSIRDPQGQEAKQKRRNRHTNRHHQSPVTHTPGPIFLKEHFCHDSTPHRRGRADKESRDSPTETHRSVRVAHSATDISNHSADQGNEKYRPTSESIAQRTPEEWCTTKNCDK